ncbi:hypothetical protein NDU88_007402 [Pleurodeles waltl]|uniref:Uncharacterized protein n=1 Tax=Pleurodeles waltl TaxID=8319 RepID=A0AAV7PLJ1_PLEWA|nr:hypothetical protein NDU88_007402 [Pleurodeles waltl]
MTRGVYLWGTDTAPRAAASSREPLARGRGLRTGSERQNHRSAAGGFEVAGARYGQRITVSEEARAESRCSRHWTRHARQDSYDIPRLERL